jgi:hypothetical protein
MVNTKIMGHVFKHPKYYEELRKLHKEEEAKALSDKHQASSDKQQADPSVKPQASSIKPQASSAKRV